MSKPETYNDISNGNMTLTNNPSKSGEPHNTSSKIQLKQRISLFNGCAIIVGVIVGSGIFVSPKGVLLQTGGVFSSLCVWLACGVYSLLGALCYAELGTTIPKSGGDYAYINEAFGSMPAFLFLWISLIIVNPTSNAVIALTFAHHVLQPFFPSCEIPETPVRLLAICITALLTYINCYNVRWATRTQDASTVTKVGALILIILVGLAQILFGESENFHWSNIRGEQPTPVGLALGFYAGVFSFSGWNYLNFVTEEIKEPTRNLPRAIYISLPIVTLIYMLVNVAYFAVLSADEVLESNAVAVTFADRMLGPVAMVMPLFVAISCIGGLNGIIFTCSRMFFAGARDGQLPELLAMINVNYLTPMPSLLFLGILSIGMIFVSDIYILINYLAFTECSVVAMSVLSLLKLRLTRPDLKRPIKFHLAIPILFLIICAYILSVPFVTSPYELIVAVIIITSGIPFYFVFVYWQDKPTTLYRPWIALTHWTQKFLYCVPDDTHTD